MGSRNNARSACFSSRKRAVATLLSLVVTAGLVSVTRAPSALAANPLTIDKTSGPNPVASGGELTYTIVVKNTGGAKVTEVTLTDVVSGMTGIDATNRLDLTSTVGTCGQTGNAVTCSAGTLAGFQSWTVTIRGIVTAPNGTTLNNTANVTGTKSATTYTSSDTVSTRVVSGATGSAPDLIATIKGPNTTPPSSDLVYTVTVNNVGTAKASDVVLAVTLPNTVTYVVATATSLFDCTLGAPGPETTTLTCTGGAVNAGDTATVQVGVVAPSFDTLVTVTTAVDPFDAIVEGDELNNASQATTQVGNAPPPDTLLLEKTDSSDPITPGETLTYTLTLKNTSAYRADYVEVVDGTQGLEAASVTATATMTNVPANAVPMSCTVAAPKVTCTTTRFAPGGIATITIKGTVIAAAGSTILNTATVNGNIRNTGVTNTASTITSVRPSIDLTVTQHRTAPVPPNPVRAADRFDYTITVGNSGLYDAKTVVVREPLPAGTDSMITMDDVAFDGFVASVPGTTCAPDAANVVSCTIPLVKGALSSGAIQGSTETIVLHLIASHAIGPITSTVTVDPANAIPENEESNNTYTTKTDVLTGIDLTVTKTGTPDPVARNGTLKYTLTVRNRGTQDSQGVVVRDVLPAGAVFRSATDVPASTAPDLPVRHNFTCSASANVVECVGGRLEGTYSGSLIELVDVAVIEIDVFAPDEPGLYHNEVRVDPYNAIPEKDETNNIFLLDTVVENTHTGNGMYKELYIEKLDETVADPPPYATSGLLDYDLVVRNAGQSAVGAPDNLVVRISLPTGSRFRAAYDLAGAGPGAFVCSHSGGVVQCSGGTVESLASRAIRIETFAPPTQGTALLQAIVDPDNAVPEADETNNSADETTQIKAGEIADVQGTYIDLKVKSILDTPDPVGTSSTLDYAVTIENPGAADAFDVSFRATLPAGATFRSAGESSPAVPSEAFSCTHASGVVTCTGARVNGSGGARLVNIRVFAPSQPSTSDEKTKARLAVLVDPHNAIPEGHEGNNAAEALTTVTIDGPGGYIDLKIAKSSTIPPASQSTAGAVVPGGRIEYTLEVSNDGTDDAFNVAVRDPLPAGMTFVSAAPEVGSNFMCQQANGVIDCTGGYMKGTDSGGGVRKILIVAKAPMEHDRTITNQAFVDPANAIPEGSEVNNTAQVSDQVMSNVDLLANMGNGTAGATPGSKGQWTFSVQNTGSGTAKSVVLWADFSPGTIAVDADAPDGPVSGTTGWACTVYENPINRVECRGAELAAGATANFTLHYTRTTDKNPIHGYLNVDPNNTIVEFEEANNLDEGTA